MHVWDFMTEFVAALTTHLENDNVRWGGTWLVRTRKGQEERTIHGVNDRFDKYLNGGQPIDWLAIVGDAMICWIREKHPEIWSE